VEYDFGCEGEESEEGDGEELFGNLLELYILQLRKRV
jgi:hypothetical protein